MTIYLRFSKRWLFSNIKYLSQDSFLNEPIKKKPYLFSIHRALFTKPLYLWILFLIRASKSKWDVRSNRNAIRNPAAGHARPGSRKKQLIRRNSGPVPVLETNVSVPSMDGLIYLSQPVREPLEHIENFSVAGPVGLDPGRLTQVLLVRRVGRQRVLNRHDLRGLKQGRERREESPLRIRNEPLVLGAVFLRHKFPHQGRPVQDVPSLRKGTARSLWRRADPRRSIQKQMYLICLFLNKCI